MCIGAEAEPGTEPSSECLQPSEGALAVQNASDLGQGEKRRCSLTTASISNAAIRVEASKMEAENLRGAGIEVTALLRLHLIDGT